MKTIRPKFSRSHIYEVINKTRIKEELPETWELIENMLLSTLPSDKEEKKCEHKGFNYDGGGYLHPSLLEGIEEIERIDINDGIILYPMDEIEVATQFYKLSVKINKLIRNQNLIINHLKHL